jgi:hypothetical protein
MAMVVMVRRAQVLRALLADLGSRSKHLQVLSIFSFVLNL